MRQYRTRISTWVILGAALMAILLMLLFYVDAMYTDIDPIYNDGDGLFETNELGKQIWNNGRLVGFGIYDNGTNFNVEEYFDYNVINVVTIDLLCLIKIYSIDNGRQNSV